MAMPEKSKIDGNQAAASVAFGEVAAIHRITRRPRLTFHRVFPAEHHVEGADVAG